MRALAGAGVTARDVLTDAPGQAAMLLRAGAAGMDAVFVLGGDGTVTEVAGALDGTGVPIGVLPGGTGNLVAGVLGIPSNLRKAVAALVRGDRRRLDLGRFSDGRPFTFAAGIGVDAAMVRDTTRRRKRWFGMAAYVVAALRGALRPRPFDLTAEVDGEIIRTRVILAMVANAGSFFRGRFELGPDVRPDDGWLDLCLLSPANTREVLSVGWRLLRGDFSAHPRMRYVKGRRIRLESDPPLIVQADGDLVGMTPVEISIAPLAATFLVPPAGVSPAPVRAYS